MTAHAIVLYAERGRMVLVDRVLWETTQSALRTREQVIKDLEREIKTLTGAEP